MGFGVGRARRVLGGMCNVTGEWFELRLWLWLVVEVYRVLFGILMKYPSIRLVWV